MEDKEEGEQKLRGFLRSIGDMKEAHG